MKPIFRILSCLLCSMLLLTACAAPAAAPDAATARPAAETQAPAPAETAAEPPAAEEPAAETESIVWPDPAIEGNVTAQPAAAEDLAAYLNYDWYTSVPIPEGYSSWSAFNVLNANVKNSMIEALSEPTDNAVEQQAAALYDAVLDTDTRNATGLGPIQDTLDALMQVESIEALTKLFCDDPLLFQFSTLIYCTVGTDAKNSDVNVAQIKTPLLSLQDSAEYAERTEQGAQIKAANDAYYKALLTHNGVTEADADRFISDAFEWETQLAKSVYPVATSYRDDYLTLTYHEYAPEAFFALAPSVPFQQVLAQAGLKDASRFIVAEPEAIQALGALYTDEHLSGVKAYLILSILDFTSGVTDAFSENAGIERNNAVYGSTGKLPDEERAYALCNGYAGELLGAIYAERYFDKSSKADITEMVQQIFDVYRTRLSAADWLTEQTRQTAIEKLDAMTLRIGYPEVYRFDWSKMPLDESKPLIENILVLETEMVRQNYARADQPVDRNLWEMSANTVNAYYNPSDNSINFPAAILEPPFYFAYGSRSQNLGGIGAVIAHEVTHAFDTTGSQFDKHGNMVNWWTEQDAAAFKARTDRVAAYYGSIEVLPDEYVHGDLTIGETVADLAAVASTLDIMRTLPDADYEEFFGSWVGVWAQRITPQMRSYYLKYDPHAPGYLRADVTVQQFEEFYQTYGVKEGDKMYLAPEKRLSVW